MSTESDQIAIAAGEQFDMPDSDKYWLLADERRRFAIAILAERTVPIGLEELASTIALREGESTEVTDDTVERVAIGLHHKHLPMMEDLGIVSYDRVEKSVEGRSGIDSL